MSLCFLFGASFHAAAQRNTLFLENFEDETITAVPPLNATNLQFVAEGSGFASWDNSIWNPNGNTFTAPGTLAIDGSAQGINSTHKFVINVNNFAQTVGLGANFPPSNGQYVTVEYDIYLSSIVTGMPGGLIVYADDPSYMTGSPAKNAIQVQFGYRTTLNGGAPQLQNGGANEQYIYYGAGLSADLTGPNACTGTNQTQMDNPAAPVLTWNFAHWYRVTVIANQINHTYDLRIVDFTTNGTFYTKTGLTYNNGTAGYIRKVWFDMISNVPNEYLDNLAVYEDSSPLNANAPTVYISGTGITAAVNANPGLPIDFYSPGAANLTAIQYSIDGGTTWQGFTTDGSTGVTLGVTSYTANVFIRTADWNALSQGNNTIKLRATNGNGTYLSPWDYTIVKDTVAPVATIILPSSSVVASLPTITGTVKDTIAGVAANSTTYTLQRSDNSQYWNGITPGWQGPTFNNGTTHIAAAGGISSNWTANTIPSGGNLPLGINMTLTINTTDTLGNTSSSTSLTFKVQNNVPTITIGTPTTNIFRTWALFAATGLNVSFAANSGTLTSVQYRIGSGGTWKNLVINDGATPIATGVASIAAPVYITSADFNSLADGTVQIYFQASNSVPQTVQSSSAVNLRKEVNVPVITLNYPTAGTFSDLPSLSGTVASASGGFGFSANSLTYTIHDNTGAQYWNGSTGTTGAWQGGTFSNTTTHDLTTDSTAVAWVQHYPIPLPANLTNGRSYTFTATITDTAGNIGTASITNTQYGNYPSMVIIDSPTSGAYLNASPVAISGRAADHSGGTGLAANSTTLIIQRSDGQYWNGAWGGALVSVNTVHGATTGNAVAYWTYSFTGATNGFSYTITPKATNIPAGTLTGSPITFFFDTTPATIIGSFLAANNSYIDVTFSEGIWGNNLHTLPVTAGSFTCTFAQNGGTATNTTISGAQTTSGGALSGGESVVRLLLSVTGVPNGLETIRIAPAAASIFDRAGNASLTGTTTGNINLNSTTAPRISGGTLATSNAYVDIAFTAGVWRDNAQTLPLLTTSFALSFTQNGGSATGASISGITTTGGGALNGGEPTVRLSLTITGTPNGLETIAITPANGTSIYDINGTAMVATQTTGPLSLYNATGPLITAGSIAADNSYVDVTFNTGVWGNSGHTLPVTASDFQIAFQQNGGTATGAAIIGATKTSGAGLLGGETTIRVLISITGSIAGLETVAISPQATSIYSGTGFASQTSQTTGPLSLNGTFSRKDYVWNGGAGNWSVSTNWTPNGVPGTNTGDTVTINSGSVTLDSILGSIASVTITQGSLSLSANLTTTILIIGNGVGSNDSILTLNGHNLNSTTFSISSDGVLVSNGSGTVSDVGTMNGTVQYVIGGASAFNVTHGGNFSYHNLEIVSGSFTLTGRLSASGNLLMTGGTLRLADSAAVQTITGNVSGAGTLDMSLVIAGHSVTVSGYVGTSGTPLAALSAPAGTLNVGSDWNVTALTHNNGTVAFTGAGTLYTANFYDVVKSGGGTTTSVNVAVAFAGRNVTVNSGTLKLANVASQTITGNVSGAGTLDMSLVAVGNGVTVNGYVGTNAIPLATLSAPAGTLNVGTDWNVTALTHDNGTVSFTAAGILYTTSFYDVVKSGVATITSVNAGVTFSARNVTVSSGTLRLADTAAIQTITGNVSGAGTLDMSIVIAGHSVTVSGYVGTGGTPLAALSAPAGTLNVAGDWNVTALTHDSGTVVMNGGGAQNVSGTTFYNLTMNKAAAAVLQPLTPGASNNWTITNAFTLTSGTLNPVNGTANTISLNGTVWDDSAVNVTFTPTGGTVQLGNNGAVTITTKVTNNFYNLTAGTGATATAAGQSTNAKVTSNLFIQTGATLTTGAHSLAVTGLVYGNGTLDGTNAAGAPAISAGSMGTTGAGNALGTLNAPSGANTISVSTDWNVATFNANNGIVAFTGTGTLYTASFYDIVKSGVATITSVNAGATFGAHNVTVNSGTLKLADVAAVQTITGNVSGAGIFDMSLVAAAHSVTVNGYVGTNAIPLAALSAPAGTLNVASDWNVTALTHDNGTVSFTAAGILYTASFYDVAKSGVATITSANAGATFGAHNVTVNSGTLKLADVAAVQTIAGNVSGAGIFDMSLVTAAHSVTVSGYVGTIAIPLAALSAPAGTLNVASDWNVTALTHDNGTVSFTAAGTLYTASFYDVAKSGVATITSVNAGATFGAHNVTVNSGTLKLADVAAVQTITGNVSGAGILDMSLVAAAHSVTVSGYVGTSGTPLASVSAPAGTLNVAGDWNVTALTHDSGTVVMNGGGAQNVSGTTFYNLTMNKAAAAVLQPLTPGASNNWTITNAFTMTSGTLNPVNGTANTISLNGTVWDDSAVNVTFTPTGGTIQLGFNGSVTITTKGTNNFYNLTVGTGATATAAGQNTNAKVTNNLYIQTGASLVTGAHSLAVTGLVYGSGTLDGTNAAGAPAISAGSMGTTGAGNALGTLNAPSGANVISVSTDWNVTSFTTNNGTVNFTGAGTFYTATFYDVVKSGALTSVNTGIEFGAHNVTVNSGTLALVDIAAGQTITGNVSGAGTLDTSLVGATHSVTVNGYVGTSGTPLATLLAPAGTLNVAGNWNVTALTHDNGTINFTAAGTLYTASFYDIVKSGALTTTIINAGVVFSARNVTVNSGTLKLVDIAAGQTITGNVSGAGTLDMSLVGAAHSVTVSGYVGTSGTPLAALSAPAGTLNVAGDWNVTALTHDNGKVSITGAGTSQILGTNIFYNLSCTVASGKTIAFAAGVTQTIGAGGMFTITGASGNIIHLVSTNPGTPWTISVPSTTNTTMSFMDVTDSNATTEIDVDAATCTIIPICTNWVYKGSFTWTGNINSTWSVAGNWNPNKVPGIKSDVAIPNVSPHPVLDQAVQINDITIAPNAQLDLAGFSFEADGANTNHGTIYLQGVAAQNIVLGSAFYITDGTVEYNGTSAGTLKLGNSYFNLTINSTTTHTLGAALAVGNDLALTSGTLDAGANPVSVAGNFSRASGAFTSTTNEVLTFNGSGAQSFTPTGSTFYDITLSKTGGTVTASDTLSIHTLALNSGTLAMGANAISVSGNWTNGGGAFTATGLVTFDGNAAQAFNPANTTLRDITINNSGAGTITSGGALTIRNLTLTAGTLAMVANNVSISGNWTNGGGLFTSAGLVTFDGNAPQTFDSANVIIANITINNSGSSTITLGGDIALSGTLTLTNGTFVTTTHNVNIAGNFTTTAATGIFTETTGTLTFDGTIAQSFDTSTSAHVFANISISNTTNVVTLANNLRSTNLTIILNANLNIGGHNLRVDTTLSNDGTLTLLGNGVQTFTGTMDTNSGTVVYNGAPITALTLGVAYFNLTMNGGAFTNVGDLTINGNFTLSNGIFNLSTFTINLGGNFNHAGGTFNAGTGTVLFVNSAVTSTISGATTFYNLDCTTGGKTIVFEATVQQQIATNGRFRMNKASGANIILESTTTSTTQTQWLVDVPITYTLDFANVDVFDSNASTNSIIVQASVSLTRCTNWGHGAVITTSVTLDTDGNGKIDAIEFTTDLTLNDQFTGLAIIVTGYTVQSYITASTGFDKVFRATLQEGQYLDTGARPAWRVTSGGSLGLVMTGLVTPADQAAPIVGYTLAIAGGTKIYVAFSEPVNNPAITYPLAVTPTSTNPITPNFGTESAYELTFATTITAAEVYAQALVNIAPFQDAAGNASLATTHRISDIGLGLISNDMLNMPVNAQTGSGADIETITIFDGTATLRAQAITLDGVLNATVGTGNPSTLYWDTTIPSGDKRGNLWLPVNINGLVPQVHTAQSYTQSTVSLNRLYSISDPKIVEGATVEFFLSVSISATPFICAYLPNPNATDWYATIRPWSFKIRNVKPQKSDVTILSNVIDPTKNEKTTLRYTLPQSGSVTIYVFDLKGDIVNILTRGNQAAGQYSVTWDGKNRGGRIVARGVYFIKIVAPSIEEIRKVLVVK